jgi:hypothetical protein
MKLGHDRLFTGAPIELPLEFHRTHPYVIEFHDGTLLRFASLLCAARSASDYGMGMVDQANDLRYTPADCTRLANDYRLSHVWDAQAAFDRAVELNRSRSSAQTSNRFSPLRASN